MKILITFLSIILISSCTNKPNSSKQKTEESPTETTETIETGASALVTIDSTIAVLFINSYINDGGYVDRVEWINNSTLASDNYKTALTKLINDALKSDPEYGLGYDPILDAQDFPDAYQLLEYNRATRTATVVGVGNDNFKQTILLKLIDGITMVDGCGSVNIPTK
ncbi:MAG: hypothetical protein ABJH98_01795 [Reichenbachiella sp.]|uniref:hypothetical protein n=1 Tax=Reichenbachiella sp. TaxID=2184521 RepID=UPI00329A2691